MDATLAKIYYGPRGYWKGVAAIKKLAKAAKVPEEVAKKWLIKQALWQIFLPVPRRIPRPKFDVPTHPHLCQLTDSDSNLKRPSDCDPRLPTFQLIRLSDLVKIRVIRASQGSVDYLLIFGVNTFVCLSKASMSFLYVLFPSSLNTSARSALLLSTSPVRHASVTCSTNQGKILAS